MEEIKTYCIGCFKVIPMGSDCSCLIDEDSCFFLKNNENISNETYWNIGKSMSTKRTPLQTPSSSFKLTSNITLSPLKKRIISPSYKKVLYYNELPDQPYSPSSPTDTIIHNTNNKKRLIDDIDIYNEKNKKVKRNLLEDFNDSINKKI